MQLLLCYLQIFTGKCNQNWKAIASYSCTPLSFIQICVAHYVTCSQLYIVSYTLLPNSWNTFHSMAIPIVDMTEIYRGYKGIYQPCVVAFRCFPMKTLHKAILPKISETIFKQRGFSRNLLKAAAARLGSKRKKEEEGEEEG